MGLGWRWTRWDADRACADQPRGERDTLGRRISARGSRRSSSARLAASAARGALSLSETDDPNKANYIGAVHVKTLRNA